MKMLTLVNAMTLNNIKHYSILGSFFVLEDLTLLLSSCRYKRETDTDNDGKQINRQTQRSREK